MKPSLGETEVSEASQTGMTRPRDIFEKPRQDMTRNNITHDQNSGIRNS